MALELTVKGKITPYTRMTQRSKWCDAKAKAYLDSQERIAWQLLEQVDRELPAFPKDQRVSVRMVFHGDYKRCDLSNLLKAIEDSGNGILWHDDRQIDNIWAWQGYGDEYITQIVVNEIAKT